MKSSTKTCLIVIAWLGSLAAAFVLGLSWCVIMNLKSEYVTADVIRLITEYVESNDGQWPQSWADIGRQDARSLTYVNWSLDPQTADRHDIMTSIEPITDIYYVYPHAQSDLRRLYDAIAIWRRCTGASLPVRGSLGFAPHRQPCGLLRDPDSEPPVASRSGRSTPHQHDPAGLQGGH